MTEGCATTPEEQQLFTEDSAVSSGEEKSKEAKSVDSKAKDSKASDSTASDSKDSEVSNNSEGSEEISQEDEEPATVVNIKGRSSTDLKVPQVVEQYKLSKVVRVSPDVVQAVYNNTETKGKVLTVTKAYGNAVPQVMIPNFTSKDISYRSERLKGIYLVLGLENSLCRSATWVSGDFAFAFMADEGFTYENLDSFIQQIY
ncbi:MAG: hypothetical protein II579_02500 [Treponema sp.]|nr:hypothetical protein [Treponema sp.]MBQ1713805.1 hypothetical protein [Treponema sp.]MBQ2207411.1 hypothetical protein [Treponema sp.]MBQ2466097.1 hypothetical protein [Treponema sp.]MBQ2481758.1 hypothetical protein [Treponema sp.]